MSRKITSRTTLVAIAAALAIAALIFYIVWMPLPDSPARDAIGEEKAVQIGERNLAYYVSGTGKPVILLASAGREASDFNELAAALNDAGYRTIAVEAHGIKGSDLPEGEFGLFDIADDIAAVAEEELKPQEETAVIGHAFGNRAARAFASRHDSRVNSVVLIASGGAKAIPKKANTALLAIFDPRRTVSQRRADIDYGFFAEGNDIPDHWLVGWYRHTATLHSQAKGTDHYEEWGSGGNNPMLVLQAAEDTIAPPQDAGIPLAKQYPDRVKLVMIAGAGHALLPEQPDVIAEEVIGFSYGHKLKMRVFALTLLPLLAACDGRTELGNELVHVELSGRNTAIVDASGNFVVYPNITDYEKIGGVIIGLREGALDNADNTQKFTEGLGFFVLNIKNRKLKQGLSTAECRSDAVCRQFFGH